MKYANCEERLKIKNKIKNTSLSLGVSTVIGAFNSENDSEDSELDSWRTNRRRFDGDGLCWNAETLTRAMAVELVKNAVGDGKKVVGDVKKAGRVLKEACQGDERSGRGGGSKTRKMMTV